MKPVIVGLFVFALTLSPCGDSVAQEARQRLELNGTWQFRLDPEDVGLARGWFAAEVDYPDEIQVPGCWQAQGFGPSRGHLRHDYQGKAWYRRVVHVPGDWSGKRIGIHVGAASNTADIYVNGRNVGFVEEFLTPYEFDVTDAVRPGKENVIACCVNSTGVAPRGMFNMIGRWGGLNREVFLEARSDPMIDGVFVIPDVRDQTARTQVVLRRHAAAQPWQG
ncbi:MAG: sugar-binding domain-containing protein, partial [Pirellulales bacterium]